MRKQAERLGKKPMGHNMSRNLLRFKESESSNSRGSLFFVRCSSDDASNGEENEKEKTKMEKRTYYFRTIDLRTGEARSKAEKARVFISREEAIAEANRVLNYSHIAGYEITEEVRTLVRAPFVTEMTKSTFRVITDRANNDRLIAGSLKSHQSKVRKTLNALQNAAS